MKRNGSRDEFYSTEKGKKVKRVEQAVLSVLVALVVMATAFIAGWFGRWGALGKRKQSLLNAIDTARDRYYQEIDEDEFYAELYKAFRFDAYSAFYTEKEYRQITSEREGQNRGAGFSIYSERSFLEVYSVLEGSSAEAAGIEEGMYLFKFGKTKEALTEKKDTEWMSKDAEDYFTFVSNLKKGEKYFVSCGKSENMSEAEVYEVRNEAQGAGIALTRRSALRIFNVDGNSPADYAGLKRGMYILQFGASEDEMTVGTANDMTEVIKDIEPDEDGNVTFYLQASFDREDEDAPVTAITMTDYQASYCTYRDSETSYRFRKVDEALEPVETEEPLKELGDKTAYIALSEFTGGAAKEFKKYLSIMKERGRTDLVLDLRGNGGGYMDVFVEIASCLLKQTTSGNQRVAYARFRDGSTISYSVKSSSYYDYFTEASKVSILADEYTASASECLIGALVDYGTVAFSDIYLHENAQGVARTYGKGIMQTYYDVGSGDMLKLTAAEIFWPKSNKTIHGIGVTPEDKAVPIQSTFLPDAGDAFLQKVLSRIIKQPSTPSAPTDSY